jgi:hypothetical protein
MGDRPITIVDCDDTVLTILVYPSGKATIVTGETPEWVAETLQKLRDTVLTRAIDPEFANPRLALDYLGRVAGLPFAAWRRCDAASIYLTAKDNVADQDSWARSQVKTARNVLIAAGWIHVDT